jgi:hypothetical protein
LRNRRAVVLSVSLTFFAASGYAVTAAVMFMGAIIAGDFCMEPITSLLKITPPGDALKVVKFYSTCSGSSSSSSSSSGGGALLSTNPLVLLNEQTRNLSFSIEQTTSFFLGTGRFSDLPTIMCKGDPNLQHIQSAALACVDATEAMITSPLISCEPVENLLRSVTTDGVCQSILYGLYDLWLSESATLWCLLILGLVCGIAVHSFAQAPADQNRSKLLTGNRDYDREPLVTIHDTNSSCIDASCTSTGDDAGAAAGAGASNETLKFQNYNNPFGYSEFTAEDEVNDYPDLDLDGSLELADRDLDDWLD